MVVLSFASGTTSNGASGTSKYLNWCQATHGRGGDIALSVGKSKTDTGGDIVVQAGDSEPLTGGAISLATGEGTATTQVV